MSAHVVLARSLGGPELSLSRDVAGELDSACKLIESRFLAAGDFLIQAVTHVEALVANCGSLVSAMDLDASSSLADALSLAADSLSAYPAAQFSHHARVETLMRLRRSLEEAADDMERTLGYMRAFVTHIGITASQIESSEFDFQSFTEDVANCVRHGGSQVGALRAEGNALGRDLDRAFARSRDLARQCQSLIPDIARGLSESGHRVAGHRRRITSAAEQVIDVAKDFRNRIGRVLTSLQVGDSVRQRIQHVGSGLAWLEARAEASSAEADQSYQVAARTLLTDLLSATDTEFEHELAAIENSVSALVSDIDKVRTMQRLLGGDASEKDGGLRPLQLLLDSAVALVSEIEAADHGARETLSDATVAARRLMPSIEAIKVMKEDVRFMAINTALRSLRVGEGGRPLRVVALELSKHSDNLDGFANTCLDALEQLIGLADDLSGGAASSAEEECGECRSQTAHQIVSAIAAQVKIANEQSERVNRVLASETEALLGLLSQPARLVGLRDGISSRLKAALPAIGSAWPIEGVLTGEGAVILQSFLDELAASYSMEQERAIHRRFAETVGLDELGDADSLDVLDGEAEADAAGAFSNRNEMEESSRASSDRNGSEGISSSLFWRASLSDREARSTG